jgi:histidinol phosphatase-like PHP family hydrolase
MWLFETMDFHVHTNRSVCCQQSQTLECLLDKYAELGIVHIAICDHYYPGKLDLFRLSRQELDEQQRLRPEMDLRLSAEIEIVDSDGHLGCPEFQELSPLLDHVSAAPHTKTFMKSRPANEDPVEYIHRAHMAAARNPDIDVILHPWDGAEAVVEGLHRIPRSYLRDFAEAAAENGKVVEVSNCVNHYWIRPTEFTKSYELLVDELIQAGVKLVVGSDGHNISLVPEMSHLSAAVTTGDTSWATGTLRRLGATDENAGFPKRHRS